MNRVLTEDKESPVSVIDEKVVDSLKKAIKEEFPSVYRFKKLRDSFMFSEYPYEEVSFEDNGSSGFVAKLVFHKKDTPYLSITYPVTVSVSKKETETSKIEYLIVSSVEEDRDIGAEIRRKAVDLLAKADPEKAVHSQKFVQSLTDPEVDKLLKLKRDAEALGDALSKKVIKDEYILTVTEAFSGEIYDTDKKDPESFSRQLTDWLKTSFLKVISSSFLYDLYKSEVKSAENRDTDFSAVPEGSTSQDRMMSDLVYRLTKGLNTALGSLGVFEPDMQDARLNTYYIRPVRVSFVKDFSEYVQITESEDGLKVIIVQTVIPSYDVESYRDKGVKSRIIATLPISFSGRLMSINEERILEASSMLSSAISSDIKKLSDTEETSPDEVSDSMMATFEKGQAVVDDFVERLFTKIKEKIPEVSFIENQEENPASLQYIVKNTIQAPEELKGYSIKSEYSGPSKVEVNVFDDKGSSIALYEFVCEDYEYKFVLSASSKKSVPDTVVIEKIADELEYRFELLTNLRIEEEAYKHQADDLSDLSDFEVHLESLYDEKDAEIETLISSNLKEAFLRAQSSQSLGEQFGRLLLDRLEASESKVQIPIAIVEKIVKSGQETAYDSSEFDCLKLVNRFIRTLRITYMSYFGNQKYSSTKKMVKESGDFIRTKVSASRDGYRVDIYKLDGSSSTNFISVFFDKPKGDHPGRIEAKRTSTNKRIDRQELDYNGLQGIVDSIIDLFSKGEQAKGVSKPEKDIEDISDAKK